jgi:hypothetical protein
MIVFQVVNCSLVWGLSWVSRAHEICKVGSDSCDVKSYLLHSVLPSSLSLNERFRDLNQLVTSANLP